MANNANDTWSPTQISKCRLMTRLFKTWDLNTCNPKYIPVVFTETTEEFNI